MREQRLFGTDTESFDKSFDAERANALQKWVDTFLSDKIWTRCLAALRQTAYVKKHKPVIVKLSWETHYQVKKYAEKIRANLNDAIDDAIQEALENPQKSKPKKERTAQKK